MTEKNKNLAKALDGRELAHQIKLDLSRNISGENRRPGLAAILIGDDPASKAYIKLKEKACLDVGISFHKYLCNSECYPHITEKQLIEMIEFLNHDPAIDGILIQLPLPKKFNTQKIINSIDINKDVDGFYPGNQAITPPVVDAILELLKSIPDFQAQNKKILTIIKNDVFFSKLSEQLKKIGFKNIARQKNIPPDSKNYDVVVIALGKARALKKSMVKKDAIIIDVGINKIGDQIFGDVDPDVYDLASYISPVPGGVGPLTVACLLRNTYNLFKNK